MSELVFDNDIKLALAALRSGGVILYPTDTIWGLGCSALDEKAISKIYTIKERSFAKSLITLIASAKDILAYVASPDPEVFEFINLQSQPTTIIFENAIGLPENLINEDGSIALRIARDPFCQHLIRRFRSPIVSTSANKTGQPAPGNFSEVSPGIISAVNYAVHWRRDEKIVHSPSRIIKWLGKGTYQVIRP